jgi:hypothetical protein
MPSVAAYKGGMTLQFSELPVSPQDVLGESFVMDLFLDNEGGEKLHLIRSLAFFRLPPMQTRTLGK